MSLEGTLAFDEPNDLQAGKLAAMLSAQ